MATIKWDADTITTHMNDTELGGLADDTNAISGAIDNTTALRLFEDLEFYMADNGTNAPTAGGVIEVYLLASVDGTNYPDGGVGVDPAANTFVGVFNTRTVSDNQRMVLRGISLPPLKYKYVIINKSGMAMNSTGSTLKGVSYGYASA